MNPYQVLGVRPDAKPSEIKVAFRRLARKYHPDRGGDPEMFQRVQTAWAVLSNVDSKARYDATGSWEEPTPDNSRGEVIPFLHQAMARALNAAAASGRSIKTLDLLKEMTKDLQGGLRKQNEQLTQLQAATTVFEEVLSRLEDKDGLLRGITESELAAVQTKRDQCADGCRLITKALAYLTECSYKVDADPRQGWTGDWMGMKGVRVEWDANLGASTASGK